MFCRVIAKENSRFLFCKDHFYRRHLQKPSFSLKRACSILTGAQIDQQIAEAREKAARETNPDFYRNRDRILFRKGQPTLEVDIHQLNPHPRDWNNPEFKKINSSDVFLSKNAQRRKDNLAQGIDETDVVVDLETFRYRDVFKNHLKNIREPVPSQDQFLIHGAYWLLCYAIWMIFKVGGETIREWKLQAKLEALNEQVEKSQSTVDREESVEIQKREQVATKRIEEDSRNSDRVLKAKAPQSNYRYDFEKCKEEIQIWTDEVRRAYDIESIKSIDPKPKKEKSSSLKP